MKRATLISVIAITFASSTALAAQEVSQAVVGLGLRDVQTVEKPRAEYGRYVYGTLPGGVRIELELDRTEPLKKSR